MLSCESRLLPHSFALTKHLWNGLVMVAHLCLDPAHQHEFGSFLLLGGIQPAAVVQDAGRRGACCPPSSAGLSKGSQGGKLTWTTSAKNDMNQIPPHMTWFNYKLHPKRIRGVVLPCTYPKQWLGEVPGFDQVTDNAGVMLSQPLLEYNVQLDPATRRKLQCFLSSCSCVSPEAVLARNGSSGFFRGSS